MPLFRVIGALLILLPWPSAHAEDRITVFAAASLTDAIGEISAEYEKTRSVKVVQSYAASSALARQIENGAPADVFISADAQWMDYLQEKRRIDAATRMDIIGNKLVLIAPKGQGFKVAFTPQFEFAKAFDGRLCTGHVDSVPIGIYAKQALVSLNWWGETKRRIVGAQDVRAAMAFVARRECAAGIVYETDARITDQVEIVGTFPSESHMPVIYPMALVANAKPVSRDFMAYMKSASAANIFRKYGFTPLSQ